MTVPEGDPEGWAAWVAATPTTTGLPVGDPDRFLLEVTPAGGHGNQVLAFDGGKCRTLVDPARFDPSGNSWVGRWDLSPDGRRLAVQITDAAEATRLWVLDRDTGDVVDGPIDRCRYTNIAWLPDSSAFFYVRTDPSLGIYRQHLLRHTVGETPDRDVELPVPGAAGDPDHPVLAPVLVGDGRWLVVARSDGCAADTLLHIADLHAGEPSDPRALQQPVFHTVSAKTSFASRLPAFAAGRFHMVSAEPANDRGAVFAVDPRHLHRRDRWRQLIPEDPDQRTIITAVGAARVDGREALIVTRARDGASWLSIHEENGRLLRTVRPPDTAQAVASVRGWTMSAHRLLVRWQAPGLRATTEHHLDGPDHPGRDWRPPNAVARPARPIETDTEVFPVRFQPAGQEPETLLWISRRRGTRGPVPTLLTGYGILGIPADPEPQHFAAAFDAWRRAGGAVASAVMPGGGDHGERRGHARDGAAGQLSEADWLRARDALVAAGVCLPDNVTALGWSGPGNTLLNLARDHPGAFPVVATAAPMVGFPQHELHDLERNPGRVPSDCSGLWKFGAGAPTTDAHRRLETLGWQKDGTHVVIAVGDQDTRVDPGANGLRYSHLLTNQGVPHTLIRTAKGGHQLDHAPPELLGGLLATAAARTGLQLPRPATAPGLASGIAAVYDAVRGMPAVLNKPLKNAPSGPSISPRGVPAEGSGPAVNIGMPANAPAHGHCLRGSGRALDKGLG